MISDGYGYKDARTRYVPRKALTKLLTLRGMSGAFLKGNCLSEQPIASAAARGGGEGVGGKLTFCTVCTSPQVSPLDDPN